MVGAAFTAALVFLHFTFVNLHFTFKKAFRNTLPLNLQIPRVLIIHTIFDDIIIRTFW
jgi:hypothetical protein